MGGTFAQPKGVERKMLGRTVTAFSLNAALVDPETKPKIPNREVDRRMEGRTREVGFPEFWTSTRIGYVGDARDCLGKELVHIDLRTKEVSVFPVPKEFRGAQGMLVTEDYAVVRDRKGRFVTEAGKVDMLSFPGSEGSYMPDPVYGIPTGEQVDTLTPGSLIRIRARQIWPSRDMVTNIVRTHQPSLPVCVRFQDFVPGFNLVNVFVGVSPSMAKPVEPIGIPAGEIFAHQLGSQIDHIGVRAALARHGYELPAPSTSR